VPILYHFQVITSYLSKATYFNLPHLHYSWHHRRVKVIIMQHSSNLS